MHLKSHSLFGCSIAACTGLIFYGDGIECVAESFPAAPSIASLGHGIQSLHQASQAVRQAAETARIAAKEAEEKLQVAVKEAEEAKAAEKLADDQIHSSPTGAASANGTDLEFNNKIKLSVEEFESLNRKAEEFQNMAEKEEAAALVQVKVINERENEAVKGLEASMQEIEDIKAATGDALKKAEMADAAKQAVESELRKWRQKEQEKAETMM